MLDKLTKKQKTFAEEYIKTLNGSQAARFAGYSEKGVNTAAARLLADVRIKRYIEGMLTKMENKRIADAEEVLEYLTRVVRDEVTEETVIFDKENGSQVAEIKAGVKDRNKAAELLGKRYALFTEKKELSGQVGVKIVDDIE